MINPWKEFHYLTIISSLKIRVPLALSPLLFARSFFYQVGYFLSPLDFLKHRLTFFLFKAAFKRLALLLLFITDYLFY
jgi:hypothetical protein